LPDAPRVLAALADAGSVELVAVRDGANTVIAADPVEVVAADGAPARAALAALTPGWWAGFVAYDLGRTIEAVPSRSAPTGMPDVLLARFDARLVLDPRRGAAVAGTGGSARALRDALARAHGARSNGPSGPTGLGPWTSSLDRDGFTDRVREIRRLLEAGECYQVNLTRRLTSPHALDPVELFARLGRENPSPHASLVRLRDVAVVSASPEGFLRWRGREVETRPIKGTARSADALRRSAKDRAENVMIVDLARNDLGRVCDPGSITVPALCAVERHPGLHHLVSTVRGRLRLGLGVEALIAATFPPASVTGAPKPRVLQVIEDLEPVRRGVYCGAIGWLDTERDSGDLAVAIRTFVEAFGETTLGVGAGIVADSDPVREWEETELKAARLLRAAGARPRDLAAVGGRPAR
jgi:para-aminobenzoate synthetase component 1